jgi:putative CocE/NonD family hydrolase
MNRFIYLVHCVRLARRTPVTLRCAVLVALFLALQVGFAAVTFAQTQPPQGQQPDSVFVRENYIKYEYQIPARDGAKLFTAVYVPRDASDKNKYPMVMERTCYDISPYGTDKYPSRLPYNRWMWREKYIFVFQDVRGRYMSEGTWTNMTPHKANKKGKNDVDEASDTYDTIDWLVKNVKYNNGRVGQWGVSYPGFYTIAGALSGHPALKASAPQAPVSDFYFDDFHHNGAFTQGYLFTFPVFGIQHPKTTTEDWWATAMIDPKTKDGWQFQYDLGPLKNATERYYKDNFFWNEIVEHPNYDEFWKQRSIVPHLKSVNHAMMTVGGWFDAEDLYGPLTIYKTLEKNNPKTYNTIVMGPFGHGDWHREQGHHLHSNIYFGDSISTFYEREIESTFFRHFLKGAGDGKTGLPEAYLFDTGLKHWRTFNEWPAKNAKTVSFYLHDSGKLSQAAPEAVSAAFSEYISDPMKPVPYTEDRTTLFGFTPRNYMSEDQRFASQRPDVLTFQTDVLTEDITLGGEITAKLKVSTSGTDADWVVKVVDVYPGTEPNHPYMPHKNIVLGGYQQMVRSEIMRSRYRNSFEKPEPMKAGEVTDVSFRLQDVLHTFRKGHRIMIQVQSTWFPAFDRNPQKYVENIYKADAADFIKATQRVYHSKEQPSQIQVQVLE